MAQFSESLTVRILGDSSHLQQELQKVSSSVEGLSGRFARLAGIDQQVGQTVSRLTALLRPVNQLSRMLDRIANQAGLLSRITIRLNVAPALQSLGVLARAIMRIIGLAQRLSALPVRVPVPVSAPVPRLPIRRLVTGGLITGRGGVDRVPALLSAGEFVLQQSVVDRLGISFLDRLNQNQLSNPQRSAASSTVTSSSETNHFGDITIHVAQPGNINGVIRDLRFHGFHLRNRRG